MPLPNPRKGETEQKFVERCMGDTVMTEDYPDEDQRLAICYSQFGKKDKASVVFKTNNKAQIAELYIYEPIDNWLGLGAKAFTSQLAAMAEAKELQIRINSDGGDVFDGIAMYNAIKRFPKKKTVFIDALAASIASVVAMAGDEIHIANNAMMMIHDPWSGVIGTADDMRSRAALLDQAATTIRQIYAERTKMPMDQVAELMAAETWMNAPDAVQYGFADYEIEPAKMAAKVRYDLSKFKCPPTDLVNRMIGVRPNLDAVLRKAEICNITATHIKSYRTFLNRGAVK